MKILVPTDFSPLSKVGVVYAAKLCVKLKAQLVIINVNYIDKPTRALAEYTTDEILNKLKRERENECVQLILEVRRQVQGDLNVEYCVEDGGPLEDTINTFAQSQRCDLIIMGTKGASGIKKAFLGSNAAAVVSNSTIPVVTVPESASFKDLTDIAYASDLKNLVDEFEVLLPIAKIFNATIHIVHVYEAGNEPEIDEILMALKLQKELNYPKIDCHYIPSSNIKSGIDRFLSKRNADIVAMFSGKRNFFERIFEKSNTMELVHKINIPLLTFSKKKI